MKSYSEILEEKIKKEEEIRIKKENREKAIKDKKRNRILKLVKSQFQYAQQTIGNRFSMKQQHNTMFHFHFLGKNKSYCCKIFSIKLEPEGDFEFSDFSFGLAKKTKVKDIGFKDIKLNELADNLIKWAKLVLEEELGEIK